MADSLGEVFVEVLGDTSPFAESLTDGIGSALQEIESEVQDALSGIGDIAEGAFGEVADAADGASDDVATSFDGAATEIQSAVDGISFEGLAQQVEDNLGRITVAAGIGGAGLEAFGRSQRDTRLDSMNLAAQLGMTEGSMNRLIAETSNATFPLEDVAALMQTAAQRGIEGEDALRDFANFWDMVGDATGEAGPALAKAAVSLGMVGIEAGNEAEALDALGYVMNNTTGTTRQFLKFVGRVGAELGDNSPSINEMAAALGALENAGFDARQSQMELRTAITQAEGDFEGALAILGISTEAYQEQMNAVEGAGAAIEGNAARFAATRTPIENMTAAVQAQLFQMPHLAEAASALAAPLAAVGPAAMGFTHGISAIKMVGGPFVKVLGVMQAGFLKLGAVILANPIFLVGILLVAVAILIWKFRDEILEAIIGAWDWIKEATQKFWDFLKNIIRTLVDTVTGFFRNLADTVRNLFERWWSWYRGLWQRLFNFVSGIVQRVRDFVVTAFNNIRDRVVEAIQSLWNGAMERFNGLLDFVRDLPARILRGLGNIGRMLFDAGKGILQGLWDGMKQVWDNLTGWVGGLGDRIRNLKGPLSYDRVMLTDIGEAIIGGLGKGMEKEWKDVEALLGGITASIPITAEASAFAQMNRGNTASGQQGGINVQFTVHNPLPETSTDSATRQLRKLAAIGVFGD
jgi:phage-related protein